MPATATPRKPQTLARKLVETRNTSRNRSLASMLGLGESEKATIRSGASAVNDVYGRGTLAGFLGIPGDLGGLLWDAGSVVNNKIKDAEVALGLVNPQQARYVPSGGMNYGGAEHIGQKMQEYGLVSPTRRPVAEMLASLISPTGLYATAAKAPQAARAGVRLLDNLDDSIRGFRMSDGRYVPKGQAGMIDVWHGTDVAFEKPNTPLFLGDRATAESYAKDRAMLSGADPVLMGGTADFKKTATDADVKRVAESLGIEVENDMAFSVLDPNISGKQTSQNVIDALMANGFDSAHIDDFSPADPTTLTKSYVAFSPDQLNLKPSGLLGKMVAPQDEALRVAQANAAKPVEEGGLGLRPDNTPEERAAAMGFDVNTPMYHGTRHQFDEFKPQHPRGAIGNPKGVYFDTDKYVAEEYALNSGEDAMDERSRIIEAYINPDGAKITPRTFRGEDYSEAVVFDPRNIRSRFAAFDPMRRDSSDILAGLAPIGLGAWMYQDEPVK